LASPTPESSRCKVGRRIRPVQINVYRLHRGCSLHHRRGNVIGVDHRCSNWLQQKRWSWDNSVKNVPVTEL
jgi:hypothetical protein